MFSFYRSSKSEGTLSKDTEGKRRNQKNQASHKSWLGVVDALKMHFTNFTQKLFIKGEFRAAKD